MTLKASDVMNGSFQPARYGTMIRWPDEETGRNSVSPCTTPMTIACAKVSIQGLPRLAVDARVAASARSLTHLRVRSLPCSAAPWPRRVMRDDLGSRFLPDE